MMLFAILFGLSMDYEVFLLSRIKEEHDRTHDNGLAVADGLAATARVITAAAAIMICVFLTFVFQPDATAKLIGLGLAAAILIDATVVRMVLVPATMELLGRGQLVAARLARPPAAAGSTSKGPTVPRAVAGPGARRTRTGPRRPLTQLPRVRSQSAARTRSRLCTAWSICSTSPALNSSSSWALRSHVGPVGPLGEPAPLSWSARR